MKVIHISASGYRRSYCGKDVDLAIEDVVTIEAHVSGSPANCPACLEAAANMRAKVDPVGETVKQIVDRGGLGFVELRVAAVHVAKAAVALLGMPMVFAVEELLAKIEDAQAQARKQLKGKG